MRKKIITGIILIVFLFISGSIIAFIGFAKGINMASALARPKGATGWTIPDGYIQACTYIPVIMGVSLILLSLILSLVLFKKWLDR